jgi:hypothetical protein
MFFHPGVLSLCFPQPMMKLNIGRKCWQGFLVYYWYGRKFHQCHLISVV